MRGVNKVILVGTLGQDPVTRYTQGGACVANFSMATNEQWADKQTGEMKQKTEWHNCVAWNRLGEIVGEYLRKGSKCFVEGKLETTTFEKDGQTHYRTQVVALNLQMLDSRQDQGPQAQRPAPNTGQGYPNPRPASAQQQALPAGDDFDDDIPF